MNNNRQSIADPQNTAAKVKAVIDRARIEGPDVYLYPLVDREFWNKTPKELQKIAAEEVGTRLGSAYDFKWMRVWECENKTRQNCSRCFYNKINGRGYEDTDTRFPEDCFECKGEGYEFFSKTFKHNLATFTHKKTKIEFQLLPGKRVLCPIVANQDKIKQVCIRGSGKHYHKKDQINPFLIARWPVTNRQFNPAPEINHWEQSELDLPVTGWDFSFLSENLPNAGLRLPTAHEWEYACRAGTKTRFYWGDEFDESHVWHNTNSGDMGEGHWPEDDPWYRPRSHSPKEHDKARKWNAFGLVDMIGNVWEWVKDGTVMGESYNSNNEMIRDWGEFSAAGDRSDIGFRAAISIPGV